MHHLVDFFSSLFIQRPFYIFHGWSGGNYTPNCGSIDALFYYTIRSGYQVIIIATNGSYSV